MELNDQVALFVEAMRAAPTERAPRMLYADWLSEHEDPRGEFIVLEHAIEDGARGEAVRRRDHLLHGFKEEWLAPIRRVGAADTKFECGLVWSARLAGAAVANVSALCRIEPVVRLRLGDGGIVGFKVAASAPELAYVEDLCIDGTDLSGVEPLLASPHLGNLQDFTIFRKLTPEPARALASGVARPLRLRLTLEEEAARMLAASTFLQRVEEFMWIGDDDVLGALAEAPLHALRRLSAHGSLGEYPQSESRAFDAFGERLDQLESLALVSPQPEAIRALIRYIRSGRLRELMIGTDDDALMADLLGSPVLRGVEKLSFTEAPGTLGIHALLHSPYRENLRSVLVPHTRRHFEIPGVRIEFEGG